MDKPNIVIPIKWGVDMIIQTVRLNASEEYLVYMSTEGKQVGTWFKSLAAALKYAAEKTIY